MKIHMISVTLTDSDLNVLISKLPDIPKVVDLSANITPSAVIISGIYETGVFGIKTPFSTEWSLRASGNKVVVKLDEVRLSGVKVPGTFVETKILEAMKAELSGLPFIEVVADELTVDLSKLPHSIEMSLSGIRLGTSELRLDG